MNEKKQAIFESLPVKKAVLLQAMPAVASQMVTLIYNLEIGRASCRERV